MIKIRSQKKYGVYFIKLLTDGRLYIGSGPNRKRLQRHFCELRRGIHGNKYLQAAFNKYGEESFRCGTILYCDRSEMRILEQNYIHALSTLAWEHGFNLTHKTELSSSEAQKLREKQDITEGPYYFYDTELKEKIEIINLTKFCQDNLLVKRRMLEILEGKDRRGCSALKYKQYVRPDMPDSYYISIARSDAAKENIKSTQSPEAKKKSRQWRIDNKHLYMGENNPFYGQIHSEETRQKIREAQPDKGGENNPNFGNKWNDAQKANLSNYAKNKDFVISKIYYLSNMVGDIYEIKDLCKFAAFCGLKIGGIRYATSGGKTVRGWKLVSKTEPIKIYKKDMEEFPYGLVVYS